MGKKILMFGFSVGMAVACVNLAWSQDRGYGDDRAIDNSRLAWADVLRVDPVYGNIVSSRPREECYDSNVDHRYDTRGNNTAGTVIGAIVGGALGNQVGKGDGRKAATVAGAVIGGAIGNNQARRDDRYYSETQTNCRTVSESYSERRIVGYDVQYRYRGDVYMSHLDYDPGERMRVRISVTPAE
ncbi:MAG TPA: glycine zipper 2TM domain-containing protein [Dokdonella sp.]|uniref:glycine zipper 2TM domain-containing protein n=1 Tax=Dokdonella sp. TaxID=2291710 RepID=UPI002D7E3E0F|nr:glycine zipper 2TM domain-containing protein [Dokdonella sp.]HET9034167.1 glycine zipper 2TM domain-containing protein [Dokdonella sp.]